MTRPHILFLLSSHDQLGDTGKKTGWYLPEFAHPYNVLSPHADITVASPSGGKAPLDPSSIDASKDDPESVSFLHEKSSLWTNTEKLSTLVSQAETFSAIFVVGGHGPMFDLATSPTSHALLRALHALKRPIAAVCHGPAALANVKLDDGSYLIANSAVTGFSNTEEVAFGLEKAMPFKLEDALNGSSGGGFQKAEEDWAPCVVVAQGGRLMTGQNPASARPLAEAVLGQLTGKASG